MGLEGPVGLAESPIISIRVPAEVKAALDRAAREDDRTTSQYASRLIANALKASGYLPPD